MLFTYKYTYNVLSIEQICGLPPKRNGTNVGSRVLPNSVPDSSSLVEGKPTKPGYYPWQIAIYHYNEFLCGGTLIDDRYILTAAHCFSHMDPKNSEDMSQLEVVLGEYNRLENEGRYNHVGSFYTTLR